MASNHYTILHAPVPGNPDVIADLAATTSAQCTAMSGGKGSKAPGIPSSSVFNIWSWRCHQVISTGWAVRSEPRAIYWPLSNSLQSVPSILADRTSWRYKSAWKWQQHNSVLISGSTRTETYMPNIPIEDNIDCPTCWWKVKFQRRSRRPNSRLDIYLCQLYVCSQLAVAPKKGMVPRYQWIASKSRSRPWVRWWPRKLWCPPWV